MKKLLLISALFITGNIFGQAVPNGGFEAWDSTAYSQPASYWYTSNFMSLLQIDIANVTQVSGYSGNAIHLQTYISGGDTVFAGITNTPFSNNIMAGQGGQPYAQQSTGITGYYRYNLPGNDTAILLILFKKSGSIIGQYLYKIRGTGSQPTWTSFSYTFTPALATTPDTVTIVSLSSNLITNKGIQNGSWLELDELAFTGPNTTIPDGNFDTWNSFYYYLPVGWVTGGGDPDIGPGVTRTTNSYAGNYAISLLSGLKPPSSVDDAFISNGKQSGNGPITGGQPYTGTKDTLIGYYMSNDSSGSVQIQLTKNSINVGSATTNFPKAATWTYFKVGFQASSTPDTILITFWSSSIQVGGNLLLDNIQIKSELTGTVNLNGSSIQNNQYPNPANSILNIKLGNNIQGNAYLYIYDITGRVIKEEIISTSENIIHVNLSDLKPGVYLYKLETPGGTTVNRFVKD